MPRAWAWAQFSLSCPGVPPLPLCSRGRGRGVCGSHAARSHQRPPLRQRGASYRAAIPPLVAPPEQHHHIFPHRPARAAMLAAMIDLERPPMLDLDDEDIVQAIADRAAVDPAFRVRLDEAAREAWRWVREVEACGRLRVIVRQEDGMVRIEVADRRPH